MVADFAGWLTIFSLDPAATTLVTASVIDYIVGDPWGWPHPVRVMGWTIAIGTKVILHYCKTPLAQRIAGVLLAIGIIGGSGFVSWGLVYLALRVNYWLGFSLQCIMLASCFAGKSLRDAAIAVLSPLEAGNLQRARDALSLYVGRDTENLNEAEILRAVLETVAENSTDGVIAPLFYAAIGGLPLAMAYKAASTLDSTIGYKENPYTYLGWFSAKLEDVLTWLPCRYTVLSVAIFSGHPLRVWQICSRDAPQDPSPNSGWSECAFAAALQVQLGGINTYRGVAKHKPLLGNAIAPIKPETIKQALRLMQLCMFLLLAIAVALMGVGGWGLASVR
ncbi:adenosylcobinamide-phosphate synthase CbiB [Pseudanabaena sp. PCC 6802]|uniref:adenosylcobinamide-phosphate synthase CbiB n=1 Tax=Pseudanabaena sp. PCC 6802 TaxID=118173 RepID=UPI00034C0FC4|nr:adenosylcobinamide-phosphate synthase CbiB [Pseudanabaena sp. PCC 6802]